MVPINEDSQEGNRSCIQTLNEMEAASPVQEIFLKDTSWAAYGKMLDAQEVNTLVSCLTMIIVVDSFSN
jgi:hypothetical protein